MSILHLTKDNFGDVISKNDIVIIDFWAQWCGPCKAFSPIFEEVSKGYPEVLFAKVDIEHEQELAADFQITSIPMLMVLRQNVVVFAQAGVLPASALQDLIAQAKALDMVKVKQELEGQE